MSTFQVTLRQKIRLLACLESFSEGRYICTIFHDEINDLDRTRRLGYFTLTNDTLSMKKCEYKK